MWRVSALIADFADDAAEAVRALLCDRIGPVAPVDYAEVVDAWTLERVDPLAGELRILVSADFSGVHLFDNVGIMVRDA